MAEGTTREEIMRLLLQHREGLSTDELAGLVGLTRTAVRLHLAGMERDGHVQAGLRRRSGGRPTQSYVLTAAGEETFPRLYHILAELLLSHLTASGGPAHVSEVLGRAGARMGQTLAPRDAGATFPQRVAEAARALQELEYVAGAHQVSLEEAEIHAYNCVFHRLAQKDPGICQLDLAIVGGIAGAAVEQKECMARGDYRCVFVLREQAGAGQGGD